MSETIPPQLGCTAVVMPLFGPQDEREFKRKFAISWLSAIEAVNYRDNCYRGWKGHKPPVEDAANMADRAWEEWVETIGIE